MPAPSELALRSGPPRSWPVAARPYRPGYAAPVSARGAVRAGHRTSVARTAVVAVGDHAVAVVAALGAVAAWGRLPVPLAVVATAVALVVVARGQRGLECLVHEASHHNWSRGGRLNDLLADALAALPTVSRVGPYRRAHLVHHARFGTEADPDLERYRRLDLEGIDRCTRAAFARSIAVRLVPYCRTWWVAIGTDRRTLAGAAAWHAAALALTTVVAGGATAAAVGATWWVAFVAVLPVIRLVGEAGEHVYSSTTTVFDGTISNLGRLQRLLVHPHGDGYHTLHHLWPRVPHHRIRRLHATMCRLDPYGYGLALRRRDRVRARPSLSASERAWLN